MNTEEKIYVGLCALFSSLIILGNLTYQKFVILRIPSIYQFELSVGAILYPMTFFMTDLITEFYGKEKATFCVRVAIFMNVTVAIIIAFMDYLPATPWSKISDSNFHQVFGFFSIAFAGSIIACYVAQFVDIYLYLRIRNLTKGKYLWLRNNGSTCISLFIDTIIVIGFMTIFNILTVDEMWPLVFHSYTWKLFFTISCTPLFYIAVRSINYYTTVNKVGIVDKA
ncbi:MAG: queuosine precursor transporter [Cetobacterium sp.]